MSESLFSPSWYRVAGLKPRMRGHARIRRHEYRGELWYVLQDDAKGRFYRFTPAAYEFIGRMDGKRTVQEVWDLVADRFGDDALTQNEVVQLLAQLHSADVLQSDVPPDTDELLRRSERMRRTKTLQQLKTPLAIRIPLLDPERFLARTVGLVRPLFSVWGAIVWAGTVVTAIVLAALHWPELSENVVDRALSAQNLLIGVLAYPLIKAVHELGHGYAVKVWGGEVHEIGVMFLVFVPVPYVDASAASEFRAKHRRVIVGAAGIFVELFIASIALFAWIQLQPGLGRSIAYSVILIASISTILFNGNPLLRYDGYYILADLLDIPNLAKRGTGYLSWLVRKYAFRTDAKRPHTAPGEPFWFVFYTITAFCYRILIYLGIVLFLASKLFFVGILLAIWAASTMLVVPVFKGAKFVLTHPEVREKRLRAVAVSSIVIGLVLALVFLVPLPRRTRTEGVVWAGEESLVRAGTAGFVSRVLAEPNTRVETGQPLIECSDPLLVASADVQRARVEELRSRYDAAQAADRVQVKIVEKELEDARGMLARIEERLAGLEIRSPATGLFVVQRPRDLPGSFVKQGDLVAFVVDVERPTIRVVVPQSTVDLVRRQTEKVEVRLAERLDEVHPAVIRREVPEAEASLPSTALGMLGGGLFAIDPTEQDPTKTFEKLFQFDLELEQAVERTNLGGRVHVRFDHGSEPIGYRWYRAIRRILLHRLNV